MHILIYIQIAIDMLLVYAVLTFGKDLVWISKAMNRMAKDLTKLKEIVAYGIKGNKTNHG